MKKDNKQNYITPTVRVFELKTQGIICSSPGGAGLDDYQWHSPLEE